MKEIIGKIISWLFGTAVLLNGILNILRGNDQLLGIALIILSWVFYPPFNKILKNRFGFSIHYVFKIILAMIITWISLAVGAIAEGFYPELFG